MMRGVLRTAVVLALSVSLSACFGRNSQQADVCADNTNWIGPAMALAGAAGGWFGGRQVNIGSGQAAKNIRGGVGALAGGAMGYGIGDALDSANCVKTASSRDTGQHLQRPTYNAPVYPWNGNMGGVPPAAQPYYETAGPRGTVRMGNNTMQQFQQGGQTCREYNGEMMVGGRPQAVWGVTCLQPDGSWRIVQ